jgi:hypothetical protein
MKCFAIIWAMRLPISLTRMRFSIPCAAVVTATRGPDSFPKECPDCGGHTERFVPEGANAMDQAAQRWFRENEDKLARGENLPLSAEEQRAKREAVERCRDDGKSHSVPTSTGNAYAHRGAGDIQWGVNGGPASIRIASGNEMLRQITDEIEASQPRRRSR